MKRIILGLLGGWLVSAFCLAENHALLIGVRQVASAYPSPILESISNDLVFAKQMASRLGVPETHIRVLSDAGQGRLPTRSNVTESMRTLAAQVSPGDFVLLYLSGHGVQQPSLIPQGGDPLDEIFLLADSQRWVADKGIANALSDKEIRNWLAALDSKQVKVWLVADTCHASGLMRGPQDWLDDEIAISGFKGLRSSWLGMKTWLQKGKSGTGPQNASRLKTGALPNVAAFMAADENSSALEIEIKRDGRKVGLFTWALAQALEQMHGPVHPEKLAQATLALYRRYPLWVARPVFEAGELSGAP